MTRGRKIGLSLLTVILIVVVAAVWQYQATFAKYRSNDPTVWEADIAALIKDTAASPGNILFSGSSSIRFWTTLAEDMQPLQTLRRGYGGARFKDFVHYTPRLFDIPEPRAAVIFVGTNDIRPKRLRETAYLVGHFHQMMTLIRDRHPGLPVFYIAITPSPKRWQVWPQAQAANAALEQATSAYEKVYFIDTGPALLKDGAPDPRFYISDGLHLSDQGYALWTKLIKKTLVEQLTP